jgi:hypothetical protein
MRPQEFGMFTNNNIPLHMNSSTMSKLTRTESAGRQIAYRQAATLSLSTIDHQEQIKTGGGIVGGGSNNTSMISGRTSSH